MAKRFVKEYALYEIEVLKSIPGVPKMVLKDRTELIEKYMTAYQRGLICEREVMNKLTEIANMDVPKVGAPDCFYTGGGIWISAMHDDKGGYYTVANDFCDDGGYLTYYKDAWGYGDEEFPCVDMVWSKDEADLSIHQRVIYENLQKELKDTLEKWG